MNKLCLGFLFMSFFMSACNGQSKSKVWTKNYEQGLYNYLDSTSKPSMPDDVKRAKYTEFTITQLKKELPNGLNSVSKDSLHALNIKIGREYALKEYGTGNAEIKPYYTIWTPLIEKTFREDYLAVFQNKYPNAKTNKFCDCVIMKLKARYPDSLLVPVPKDINLKVAMECKNIFETP
ncbi:MAG: hypothetical protein JWR05_3374 [Mucilaginibacter sp.]|nr:hypothetical protein [Mucilaginibacter sp.]